MMSMLHLLWIVPLVAGVAWGFGYKANPERVKTFVKAHIVDEDPYQDEGHSATRYAPEPGESPIAREARKAAVVGAQGDYIDWSKVPEEYNYVGINMHSDSVWMSGSEMHHEDDGYLYASNGAEPKCFNYLPYDAIIGPLPTWRESLRKRPS